MVTIRRSACRVQKNVAETDEKSPRCQPASIHSIMAVTKTRFGSDSRGSSRDSITVPCIERTTYQRRSCVGSHGSNVACLRTMRRTYLVGAPAVHSVVRDAASCMKLSARRRTAPKRPAAHRMSEREMRHPHRPAVVIRSKTFRHTVARSSPCLMAADVFAPKLTGCRHFSDLVHFIDCALNAYWRST
jgi:hypothetical protein